MWTVFKASIRNKRGMFIILVVITLFLLWMYAALLPSFSAPGQTEMYSKMMESFPKEMLVAFNIDVSSLTSYEGFLGMEQFGFIWPIVVMVLIGSYAGGALAGEVDKGTMNLLLAQPVSRRKVFWGKYLAGVFLLLLFTALTIPTAIPLGNYYQLTFTKEHFLTFSVIAFLFAWSMYSICFLFSSLVREAGRASLPTVLVLIISYAINVISTLKDNLKDLKFFSAFHYYDTNVSLVHGQLDEHSVLVFAGIILVCTLLSAQIFQRRDLTA